MLDVEADGRKGGLALLWNRKLDILVKSYSSHHIEAVIEEGTVNSWRFEGFYGHHEASEHVSQRRSRPTWQMNNFNQAVKDCRIFDIGCKGYLYTWNNNFIAPFSTRARLDRALAGREWSRLFPEAELHHGSTYYSDHLPLFLCLGTQARGYIKPKPRFKFEANWCLYGNSTEVVRESWNANIDGDPGVIVFNGIRQCRLGLLNWKRVELGNFQRTLEEEQLALDLFQQGPITHQSKVQAMGLILEIDKMQVVCLENGAVLQTPFILEDVKRSLFSMHVTKSPRLDVGNVLATRLKSTLPSVISESQSAFVPRKLITDNVLLSFEAHHFIKNQRRGKKGFMFIKLDMLKAYDRIKWSFLRAMLIKLGFSVQMVKIIMDYVTSMSYSVLINGDQAGFVKPSCGLRRGTLYPLIFS
ncbi:hypothetical protein LIER_43036 [Lithospermum erythrorhizon]|uniref:Reverse transcriptase domain-containing protein n=1 Tax=Lithospermum erythrorhizon TaxID=34254 RepID=A0AAV3PCQ6_LITER